MIRQALGCFKGLLYETWKVGDIRMRCGMWFSDRPEKMLLSSSMT